SRAGPGRPRPAPGGGARRRGGRRPPAGPRRRRAPRRGAGPFRGGGAAGKGGGAMTWNRRRKRRARLRRVGYACAALAGLAGGLTVAGVLLPAEHESVERSLVDRPPETVWRVLIDLDGMPRWRSDL